MIYATSHKNAEGQCTVAFRILFLERGREDMGFRVRDKQMSIRVTEYERQLIQERVEKSGAKSLTEYVLDTALDGYIINVDYSDIKALTYEINKIGTNINQIAHRVNSNDAVSQRDIKEVQDQVDLIWKMLRAKFNQMP